MSKHNENDDGLPAGNPIPRVRAIAFQEGNWWIAQVLEYDLATQAKTLDDLAAELERLLALQVHASLEGLIEPFLGFEAAPLHFWEMYQDAAPLASIFSTEIRASVHPVRPHPASTLGPFRREDYLRLSDEPRCELLYGRFLRIPSPSPLHQVVLSRLWRTLDDVARDGAGLALAAPLDTVLADHTILQPDVLFVSAERIAALVGDRIEGAPDLIIEVLSADTIRSDRGSKLRAYAESGVREYWLVDPSAGQIDFLVNRSGRFELALPVDEIYSSETMPQLALNLVDIWNSISSRLPERLRISQERSETGTEGPGDAAS